MPLRILPSSTANAIRLPSGDQTGMLWSVSGSIVSRVRTARARSSTQISLYGLPAFDASFCPSGERDRKSTRLNSSHLGIPQVGFLFEKALRSANSILIYTHFRSTFLEPLNFPKP